MRPWQALRGRPFISKLGNPLSRNGFRPGSREKKFLQDFTCKTFQNIRSQNRLPCPTYMIPIRPPCRLPSRPEWLLRRCGRQVPREFSFEVVQLVARRAFPPGSSNATSSREEDQFPASQHCLFAVHVQRIGILRDHGVGQEARTRNALWNWLRSIAAVTTFDS